MSKHKDLYVSSVKTGPEMSGTWYRHVVHDLPRHVGLRTHSFPFRAGAESACLSAELGAPQGTEASS